MGKLFEGVFNFVKKHPWIPYVVVSLAGLTLACFAQTILVKKGMAGGPILPFSVLFLLCAGLLIIVLNILTHLSRLILGLDSRTIRAYHCLTFFPIFLLWPYIVTQRETQDSVISVGALELHTETSYQLLALLLCGMFGLIVALTLSRHEEREEQSGAWKPAAYLAINVALGFAVIVGGFKAYDHSLVIESGKSMGHFQIEGEKRNVLARPIPSELTIELEVPTSSVLHSGFGVTPALLDDRSGALACELSVSGGRGPSRILLDQSIDDSSELGWVEGSLALEAGANKTVELKMKVHRAESSFLSALLEPAAYYLRVLALPAFDFDISHRVLFWVKPSVVKQRGPGETSVILIGIDALRADHLPSHGYTRATSPSLDKFAETAIAFTNCRSGSPWTLPSFFSIMTSTYPSAHRYGTNIRGIQLDMFRGGNHWMVGQIFPDYSLNTLGETLQKHGYYTAAFANNHFLVPEFEFDRGFVEFNRYEHTARTGVDKVLEWLERHGEEKFFLFVHLMDPHDYMDYFVDEEWVGEKLERFGEPDASGIQKNVDDYDSKIHLADEHLGRLLEAIDGSLLDSSVIALTADHGEEFMDHGNIRHGKSLYDEMLKVPLLFRLPGRAQAGKVIEEPVNVLDIAPTLMDLLDLPIPDYYEGETLVPVIHGEALSSRPLFAENLSMTVEKKAVMMYPYKLIYTTTTNTLEMYDLEKDPKETRDIIGEIPEVEGRMRRELESFLARSNRAVEVRLHPSPGQRACAGRLITRGAFVQVMPLGLERLDVFQTNKGANEILFTLGPEGERRGFMFDIDPPDAPIRLELNEAEGASPMKVYLGSQTEISQAAPFEFTKIMLEQLGESEHADPKIEGIHIVSRRSGAESKTVSIDDESKKALQALGYLK